MLLSQYLNNVLITEVKDIFEGYFKMKEATG
jgi:hypothetical protein